MKSSLLACVVPLMLAGTVYGAVIDTRPANAWGGFSLSVGGPDSLGGTFMADRLDKAVLLSFTLSIDMQNEGGVFRGIVMATDAQVGVERGRPNGTVLWESPDTAIPSTPTDIVFSPGIQLVLGQRYYVGFDTGLYTTTSGGDLYMGFRTFDVISNGMLWQDTGSGFASWPDYDIATRIETSAVPVPTPGSFALMGLGAAGIAFLRRKRKPAS